MKDRMVISVEFKRKPDNQIAAYFAVKPKFDQDKCDCFLAMVSQLPKLMELLFGSIEAGARWLVESNRVNFEPMRRMLEQSTVSSIDEIEKYRNLVKVD